MILKIDESADSSALVKCEDRSAILNLRNALLINRKEELPQSCVPVTGGPGYGGQCIEVRPCLHGLFKKTSAHTAPIPLH